MHASEKFRHCTAIQQFDFLAAFKALLKHPQFDLATMFADDEDVFCSAMHTIISWGDARVIRIVAKILDKVEQLPVLSVDAQRLLCGATRSTNAVSVLDMLLKHRVMRNSVRFRLGAYAISNLY